MKTLERGELKKLMGGSGTSITTCKCPDGQSISCGLGASSSQCFETVYNACGGQPALWCWSTPIES